MAKIETIEWSGEPVSKPCALHGMDIRKYHSKDACAGVSISSSGLRKIFTTSPAHFYDTSPLNPDRAEEPDARHFVLGRAMHHLILGERWFSKSFAIQPTELAEPKTGEVKPWHGNRTVCKEWITRTILSGLTPLTADMIQQIKGMAISLGKHDLVQAGILRGLIEVSLLWKDDETGIWLKARPDAIPTDSGDFSDAKTISDIMRVDHGVRDLRYDIQGALIREGARKVLGVEMTSFTLVFVEAKRPHCVKIVTIEKEDLDAAELDMRQALRTFAHCLKTGDWFGPDGTQRDARPVYFDERFKENAKFRRELLEREIQK